MITVLAGGVGGSKFIHGFSLLKKNNVVGIINTGDDIEMHGLYVSPDIDINIYRLANVIDDQGWGFKDDTYQVQETLKKIYNYDCWFNLGDKDIATHIFRSNELKNGFTLSDITKKMCKKFNLSMAILPMSDNRVSTYIKTENGMFHFQEYLIKRRMTDKVISIEFQGCEVATPAPGIIEAIRNSSTIIIAPSNPLVSISPILSVPGIREELLHSKAKIIAISPIINGNVLKGPLAKMMTDLNYEVSPVGIAKMYSGLIDAMIIDHKDTDYSSRLEDLGLQVLKTNIIIDTDDKKKILINETLQFANTIKK